VLVVLEVGSTGCPACLAWFGLGSVPINGAKAAGAGNPTKPSHSPELGSVPKTGPSAVSSVRIGYLAAESKTSDGHPWLKLLRNGLSARAGQGTWHRIRGWQTAKRLERESTCAEMRPEGAPEVPCPQSNREISEAGDCRNSFGRPCRAIFICYLSQAQRPGLLMSSRFAAKPTAGNAKRCLQIVTAKSRTSATTSTRTFLEIAGSPTDGRLGDATLPPDSKHNTYVSPTSL
jgi:hypothetical protein